MSKRQHKSIPKFKSYQEESAFWKSHDPADYLDFSRQTKIKYWKNLKEKVTVRFTIEDLEEIRELADKKAMAVATFIRWKMLEYLESREKESGA